MEKNSKIEKPTKQNKLTSNFRRIQRGKLEEGKGETLILFCLLNRFSSAITNRVIEEYLSAVGMSDGVSLLLYPMTDQTQQKIGNLENNSSEVVVIN